MAGKQKLSEQEERLIIGRVLAGKSVKAIAEEFHLSASTIKRIKKRCLTNEKSDTIAPILNDYYITNIDKYKQMKEEQVRKEVQLFEDNEEGWTYNITKDDGRRKFSGKWWIGIAYPESAPDGWQDKLSMICECAVSPLHDKDTWNHDSPARVDKDTGEILAKKGDLYKQGDRKKSHWHFICIFDKPMYFDKVNAFVRNITHGPLLQLCGSLKSSYEYFLHINAPEKYQGYDRDDIYRSANFHIVPNDREKDCIFQDICNYIKENEIDSRLDLVGIFGDKPEYLRQLKSGSFISGLLAENWLKHNPDGRIRRVRIEKDER